MRVVTIVVLGDEPLAVDVVLVVRVGGRDRGAVPVCRGPGLRRGQRHALDPAGVLDRVLAAGADDEPVPQVRGVGPAQDRLQRGRAVRGAVAQCPARGNRRDLAGPHDDRARRRRVAQGHVHRIGQQLEIPRARWGCRSIRGTADCGERWCPSGPPRFASEEIG